VDAAFPRLWHERRLTRISLRELSRKASETLVREVLGSAPTAERVRQIVERAGGNAFYLEELIRAEAEGKGAAAPQTVLAMVQARLEHLEPDARRVLRAASIFGQVFWKGGVEALLAAKSPAENDATFSDLRARELIEPREASRFAGEHEMAFRHALVREAAYGMLTESDRVLGHKLAAEWLVASGENDPATLAEHFEAGGARDEAATFYARAAEAALDASDMDTTLARVDRAIACGAQGELKGWLRAIAAEARAWSGDYPGAESLGLEAMELSPVHGSRWCHAASWVAAAAGPLGHKERLVAIGRDLANIPTSDRTRALAQARTAMQLLYAGEYEVADALIARLTDARTSLGDDLDVDATVHQLRAQRAMCAGDPGDALELSARAAEAFEQAGNVREACYERQGVALSYMQLGAWSEAESSLRGILEIAERANLPRVVAIVKHNLGLVSAHLGKPNAEQLELESLAAFTAQGDRRLAGAAHMYLAMIHALEGDHASAESEARQAIELSRNVPPVLCEAKAVLARALLARGRPAEAHPHAEEAMALLDELGTIEEGEAMVRLAYAESLLARGAADDARAALDRARARVLERAEKIGDERWRRSFLENVPEVMRTLSLAGEAR
jgi:tetratricopeptide (TPR) repeat protein